MAVKKKSARRKKKQGKKGGYGYGGYAEIKKKPAKKKKPSKKKPGIEDPLISGGPQLKGRSKTITFTWDGDKYTITLKPWRYQDICKRSTVANNQPLLVIEVDGYKPKGYAVLKTVIKSYIVSERKYDWRPWCWLRITDLVAHLWARVTMPNNKLVQYLTRYLDHPEFDGLKESLCDVFGSGGVGEWWTIARVKELRLDS